MSGVAVRWCPLIRSARPFVVCRERRAPSLLHALFFFISLSPPLFKRRFYFSPAAKKKGFNGFIGVSLLLTGGALLRVGGKGGREELLTTPTLPSTARRENYRWRKREGKNGQLTFSHARSRPDKCFFPLPSQIENASPDIGSAKTILLIAMHAQKVIDWRRATQRHPSRPPPSIATI